jgi:hypothetical protein
MVHDVGPKHRVAVVRNSGRVWQYTPREENTDRKMNGKTDLTQCRADRGLHVDHYSTHY